MSLQQIQLTTYDIVVAVTQNSINEMLALYLNQLQKNVALYYAVDHNGNYVPTTPANAVFSFTGTLGYAVEHGVPVNIVQLYNEGQPQTVKYNVTFSNAEFKSVAPGLSFDVKQTGGDPWIISFLVNLALAEVSLASLPANVRQKVGQYVGSLPPDTFSIQQLYIDLNTAAFDTFQNIENMTQLAGSLLSSIIKNYLVQQQQQGGYIFGYALHAKAGTQHPPTFLPTALDFGVTPYTDAAGQHSTPGLDTLNYLLMTQNHPLPANPPMSFGFNWVDDNTEQGALAVRHDLIINFLVPQFNGILQTISPTVHASAKHSRVTFGQGSPQTFTVHDPPRAGNVVAYYSYSTGDENRQAFFGGDSTVSSKYSATCQIAFSGDMIRISGTTTCSAREIVSPGDNETDMPDTTYSWYADLQLQMDLSNNGSLDIVVTKSDFNSPPSVANHDIPWWERVIASFGSGMQQYVHDFGGLQSQVQTNLGQILPALKSVLAMMNGFVFPGANTFAFKNPQFSGDADLASNITYLST